MKVGGNDNAYLGNIYKEAITSPDRVQELRSEQTPQVVDNNSELAKKAEAEEVVRTPRKNTDISDIKVSLGNRDSSLVGLGNLGGIQSSVIRKAVSDMQKDSVLHEYQYFVGSGAVNNRVIMSDEDGIVVRI